MRRTLKRPDVRLAVTDSDGDGRPIVLVHGLSGSQREWRAVVNLLTDHGRVITYDQRCHGRSTASVDHSWSAFVDDLEALLEELDLHDVTLVGHSYGAGVALAVAVRNENCRALALVDGAFPVPEPPPNGRRAHMLVRSVVMLAKWALLRPFHRVHALSSSGLREVGDDYRGRYLEFDGNLRALECPTTFILGSVMEEDPQGPAFQTARQDAAARAAQANPRIEVEWIEAQHGMIRTHAPEVSALLVRLHGLD